MSQYFEGNLHYTRLIRHCNHHQIIIIQARITWNKIYKWKFVFQPRRSSDRSLKILSNWSYRTGARIQWFRWRLMGETWLHCHSQSPDYLYLQLNSDRILLKTIVLLEGYLHFNSFPPGQNGRHSTDDNFRCIFVNEKFWISNKISLKFVPLDLIDINPALV